tara:strand:- start:689 stop:997 length:309 start_codon:yes stop_codon:yes gene_type:complete
MGIVNYTQMYKLVNAMMFNNHHHHLDMAEIESLADHEYSMFLAYGDTLTDFEAVPIGEGSDLMWEDEIARLLEAAAREELLLSQCVRDGEYNQRTPFSYQIH